MDRGNAAFAETHGQNLLSGKNNAGLGLHFNSGSRGLPVSETPWKSAEDGGFLANRAESNQNVGWLWANPGFSSRTGFVMTERNGVRAVTCSWILWAADTARPVGTLRALIVRIGQW